MTTKNARYHTVQTKDRHDHNAKLLEAFEKQAAESGAVDGAKIAIIIGGSDGGHIHVGLDMTLSPGLLIQLLDEVIGQLMQHSEPFNAPGETPS